MNRILILIALVAMTTTSCLKKTHTCTCKDPERGNEVVGSFNITSEYTGDASIKCINKEIEYNNLAMYDYVTCEIED